MTHLFRPIIKEQAFLPVLKSLIKIFFLHQHILLNGCKQFFHTVCRIRQRHFHLFKGITSCAKHLACFDVARSKLDTYGYAFHFPFVELPTRAVIGLIERYANTCFFQLCLEFFASFDYAALSCRDRNDYALNRGYNGGKRKTAFIAVRLAADSEAKASQMVE